MYPSPALTTPPPPYSDVNAVLIPPASWYSCSWQPFCHHKYLQYQMIHDILGHCVLESEGVFMHILKHHHYHCCIQRRVITPSRHVPCCLRSLQTAAQPVVESSKGPPCPRCHQPSLQSKQEVRLDYLLVESAGGLGVSPLLPKNPI